MTEEGKGWSLTYHLLNLGGVTNVLMYSFVYSFESDTEEVPDKDDQGRKFETEALIVSQVCRKRAVEMVLGT